MPRTRADSGLWGAFYTHRPGGANHPSSPHLRVKRPRVTQRRVPHCRQVLLTLPGKARPESSAGGLLGQPPLAVDPARPMPRYDGAREWGCFWPTPNHRTSRTFPFTAAAPGYKSGNGRRYRLKSTQGTSTSGRLAGSLLYSTVRPRQFIVVPLKEPPEKPVCAGCTHHSNRRPPLQATPLPRCHVQPQPHPTTENGN